ncbi:uncharacterized protein LOC131800770 [Musca domestica]|uniref:Uncharacterized protein LOC131800770 n=1 Tax=Musca domestica TaxID=7370 RepID=A0ABM3ULM7_MUSDO|nr:uncharacterized protein LOC131800770 [Musca domestica]
MELNLDSPAAAFQRSQATVQSTPNSPCLMPRRTQKPPPLPAKPTSSGAAVSQAVPIASNQNVTLKYQQSQRQQQVNPAASLDAPWLHFSSLTENLDDHQVNNYTQDVPEVGLIIPRKQ